MLSLNNRLTKILSLLAAIIIAMSLIPPVITKADVIDSGTCGDNLTWTLDSDGTLTISGEGEMEEFNNNTVYPWYSYKDSITKVVINSGVENIGGYAFYEYSKIKDLEISNGVSKIGSMAFYGCGIISLFIPESITKIVSNTFACCNSLEQIIVDEKNEIFNSGEGCNAIIRTERNQLIRGCNNTIIPDSVTLIGDYAFSDCIGLDRIKIPDNVTSIGSWSFLGCSTLESIEIPNSVTSIGQSAFSGCSSLENITITDSVTYISHSAFSGCSSLTSFIIPNGITSIGTHMFNRCSSLTYIFIPDSVTKIGSLAFSGCSSLSNVIIPDTVTTIEDYAFRDCRSLTALEIPDSVASIGSGAFYGCRSLESIVIPDNTSIIDSRQLFYDCQNLTSIQFPDGVTSIGERMFYNCSSLTEISIPESVTDIGEMAFCKCRSLVCINIPESVTSISKFAFSSCSSLIEIEIPDSVTNMDSEWLLNGCSSLIYIKLPDSITNIGNGAFQGCSSLLGIEIPNGVISIETQAFYGCSSLNKVIIPNSITSIGANAFRDCNSLKYIELSNTISSIGRWAFHDSGIEDVYFDGTKEDWDNISGSEDQEYANLFTLEDLDISLSLDISLRDVKGGVAVTISGADSIYYTLDDSMPCTVSVPYEGTFILEEPGEYFINARAFDLEQGTYGEIATKYVYIEQSEKPEIREQNGQITITGDGDIYYSLNPEEKPSALSYQYEEPINDDEITVIKAICIEEGKAASEVAGYVRSGKSISPLNLEKDTFQFDNQEDSFGYVRSMVISYYIPEERYHEIFGNTMGRLLYQEKGSIAWQGSCYGMSVAALLFNIGFLNISDYSDEADTVSELLKPGSPDSQLTKLIEKYQISQYLYENLDARDAHQVENSLNTDSNKQRGNDLISAVEGALSGGDPVILILFGISCHCVVPYRMTENRIYVYDSKYPGNDNRFISYSFNDEGIMTFEYEFYNKWISYDSLSGLMNGLEENLQGSLASLFGEKESRILLSLNTDDIEITDIITGEEAEYVTYSGTDEMSSGGIVVSLKTGAYRIVNNDRSLDSITVSAATDEDYQTVTVHDPAAVVEVRERNGKVYICVTSDGETGIESSVMSSKGYRNSLSLSSDYAEIYSTTDRTVVIRTKTSTAIINGEEQELINDEFDTEYYFGAAVSPDEEIGARLYSEGEKYTLSTDITSLPDDAFNLAVFATGGNENTMLYAASYSDTGRMIAIKGTKMTAGKTRYVFGIGKDATEVKVFMVSTDKYKPLVNSVAVK